MNGVGTAVVISVLVTVLLGLAAAIVYLLVSPAQSARRLLQLTHSNAVAVEASPQQKNLFTCLLLKVVRLLRTQLGLAEDEKLRQKLVSAGLRQKNAVDIYFGIRMLGPVFGVLIGTFIHQNTFLWIAGLMVAAYIAPDFWVGYCSRRRHERIRTGLPDALDLMVVCVDAGLGIDQAMLRAGQEMSKTQPEISEELIQVNFEQRAGKPRLEAWQSLAERTNVDTIQHFVHMLAQTDRFGTPLVRALRIFTDGVRQKRRQQAEELAAKTTVKLIFPLVLFIFPSVFIVLLGPAVISISRNMDVIFR